MCNGKTFHTRSSIAKGRWKGPSVNAVQSTHKSTTGLALHSHAITRYSYLVSTENPAVDPVIYMTAIARFYITISLMFTQ